MFAVQYEWKIWQFYNVRLPDLYLYRRVTAPATTGEATLVPDRDLHPPLKKH